MTEWKLFPDGTIPECSTPDWYAQRERAPHLEEGGHRERLQLAARFVLDAAKYQQLSTVVDLGAGDGGLLSLLGDELPAWGYDLQQTNIDGAAERGVDVLLADVLHDDIEWGEIAVATEMIEHLVDPHFFVRWVRDHARVLVASSPRFETDEHHYEHHLWAFDKVGYRKLFEDAGWQVFAHEPCGPFQVVMALARPR